MNTVTLGQGNHLLKLILMSKECMKYIGFLMDTKELFYDLLYASQFFDLWSRLIYRGLGDPSWSESLLEAIEHFSLMEDSSITLNSLRCDAPNFGDASDALGLIIDSGLCKNQAQLHIENAGLFHALLECNLLIYAAGIRSRQKEKVIQKLRIELANIILQPIRKSLPAVPFTLEQYFTFQASTNRGGLWWIPGGLGIDQLRHQYPRIKELPLVIQLLNFVGDGKMALIIMV